MTGLDERPVVLADGTAAPVPPTQEWRDWLGALGVLGGAAGLSRTEVSAVQHAAAEDGRGPAGLGEPEEFLRACIGEERLAEAGAQERRRDVRLAAVVVTVVAVLLIAAVWLLPWHPVPATVATLVWLAVMLALVLRGRA